MWSADGSGVPLVLSGHRDWVVSAGFCPDGTRVLTASRDRTARIWSSLARVTIQGLQERLSEATTDCLSPEQRGDCPGEGERRGRDGYERCERAHGRTPAVGEADDR